MPMFPAMRPEEFIAKWRDTEFGERQGSQEMFADICRLVGHPTPGEFGDSQAFTFEKRVPGGFADAYLEERFGWEFKGSDADLDDAMNQLLRYQVHLKTPPLLIVSSFRTIRVRTNFPGMETVLHEIPVAALDRTENLDKLRWAFHAPDEFRPDRSVDTVTKETADLFQAIVEDMEQRNQDPEKLARYLTRLSSASTPRTPACSRTAFSPRWPGPTSATRRTSTMPWATCSGRCPAAVCSGPPGLPTSTATCSWTRTPWN